MAKKLKHYKHKRYKAHKKPINKTTLVIILSCLTVFVLTVLLGIYLGTLADNDYYPGFDTTDENGTKDPYGTHEKLPLTSDGIYPLSSAAYLNSAALESSVLQASGKMQKTLCVWLTDKDGAPTYDSDIYKKVYSAEGGALDFSQLIEKAAGADIKIVALMRMFAFEGEYSEVSDMRLAYETALIKECSDLGIKEIYINGTDNADADTLYALRQRIRLDSPSLAVVVTADYKLPTEDPVRYAKLADIFDAVSLDFSSLTEGLCTKEGDTQTPDTNDMDPTDTDGGITEAPPSKKDILLAEIKKTMPMASRFGSLLYFDIEECTECVGIISDIAKSLSSKNFIISYSAEKSADKDAAR